ncbi:Protein PAM68, chloroplastic [Melia azedarach]|uniref:Protein PAM68, chloroplastic n=1 Tax=Melia azedarach TaxID=155640 RepID=A0ACC1X454_MELAZ|nr:Protein PAM68, chloroplastic [Melia azedarach]
MRTLLFSQKPPLLFPSPSVWNPGSTFTNHKSQKNPINSPPTTWKLHANAKGFGARSTPASIKERASGNNNNNNEEDHLPQVVLERMIVRILVSVGVPLATGIALLYFLGVVKEKQLFNVPLWLPLLTTFLTFGMSAVGIAYGSLSSSWDADKKGSLLGVEEAKQNWVEMWTEDDS